MTTAALAIAVLTMFAALIGGGLGALARTLDRDQQRQQRGAARLTEQLNAALPQLQCGECGYPGCRPYAAAIAAGDAAITLCPPGGDDTAKRLATLLNTDVPAMPPPPPRLIAAIRADDCVGCALCLPACPTDAIIGAPRHAHLVITEHCVGCELCLPPCPVDCIDMIHPAAAIRAPARAG